MYDQQKNEIEASLEAELNALYAEAKALRAVQMEDLDRGIVEDIRGGSVQTPYDKRCYTMAENFICEAMEWGDFSSDWMTNAYEATNLILGVTSVFWDMDPKETKPIGRQLWRLVQRDLVGFLIQMKKWFDIATHDDTLTDGWFEAHGYRMDGCSTCPDDYRDMIQGYQDNFQAILEAAVLSSHEREAATAA